MVFDGSFFYEYFYSVESIGYFAGVLTSTMFIPQIAHMLKTRSARDVSLTAYVISTTSGLLWILYGVLKGSAVIVVVNTVISALAITTALIKIALDKSNLR
ncbi:SemiSWEET family sugar transporter [Candidatus Hydrogenosomobacter endosymbioticus]|uniref:MtN3 and saliva related transmembrane protein n=1 Tax=Candidatus Hydrogenosomobacter endosymbioticus TaxID=2558174 RepID=A0ABN6L303_9PROT|nr:SemiSWEET family transporter [Candidatus Hydrogenosomobacter endosymbioticus]BDB96291.1 hypothetical protein HYD_4240 [Candidatus Hydrogenosomobacter endosymbioticus]